MTKTCLIFDHDWSFAFATKVDGRPAIVYRCRRGCGLMTKANDVPRSLWATLVDWLDGQMRRLP